LQCLKDQVKQWREKIDQIEAGQHLDRSETLAQLAQLLDVCQNLRYAILSEDCTATWLTREELYAVADRLDDAASKRRRYLDLAQLLGGGTVSHRRERTRQERLRQRDAAVAELMEISALPAPPNLPGPAIEEWLNWACNLDDSSDDPGLLQLKDNFPRLDDFVAQLEIELWQSSTVAIPDHVTEPVTSVPAEMEIVSSASVPEAAHTPEQIEPEDKTPVIPHAKTDKTPVILEAEITPAQESLPEVKPSSFSKAKQNSPVASEPEIQDEPAEEPTTTADGKICFFSPDIVGKFERSLATASEKGTRKVRALLAISNWLTPPDQNPVLHRACGMRALIDYTGSSDLIPVSPDEAAQAIESDNGALLFTGGADLLRWGIAQQQDDRFEGIASVRRLTQNQVRAWFKDLHKIELAEPQLQDMYELTHGIPLLVGELHRMVIPDPKVPPTWLGFMIWTTIKSNFERRLPVVARELRNGSPAVRLTEREIRVLKMAVIASENSTRETIKSNLQENWDQYDHPELEALSEADEDSVGVLQGLGLLPMRRDFGLTPIQAILPVKAQDPLRQIVSHL
jgi:hypothetical protein